MLIKFNNISQVNVTKYSPWIFVYENTNIRTEITRQNAISIFALQKNALFSNLSLL